MQCPSCDASILEVEALNRCPVCGYQLGDPDVVFPPYLGDGQVGEPPDEDDIYLEEVPSPEELVEASDRHPAKGKSTKAKKPLKPPNFFQFRVHTGGKEGSYWVRSSAKTPARDALRPWLKGQGVVLTDQLGHPISRIADSLERGKAYRKAMPLTGGPLEVIPQGARGYLDAYGDHRDDPVWVQL